MARSLTAEKRAILFGKDVDYHGRIEILRDGVWYNLSNLEGHDRVVQAIRRNDIELRVAMLDLMLSADTELNSLLPGDEESSFYFSADPLLKANRQIRAWTATTRRGVAPTPSDWALKFHGYLGARITPSSNGTFRLQCRDLAQKLLQQMIAWPKEFGSDEGEPIAQVMQAMVDEYMPPGHGVVIYEPKPTGKKIYKFTQDIGVNVWQALQDVANGQGLVFMYWYDEGTKQFRPTILAPDRGKTIPDETVTSRWDIIGDYSVEYSTPNRRNTVVVGNPEASTNYSNGGQPFTDESCSLVSGCARTYQIDDQDKRYWDSMTDVVVKVGGVAVDRSNIAFINYTLGYLTFKSGFAVNGPVTVSGKYHDLFYTATNWKITDEFDEENPQLLMQLSGEDTRYLVTREDLVTFGNNVLGDVDHEQEEMRVQTPYYEHLEEMDLIEAVYPSMHTTPLKGAIYAMEETWAGEGDNAWTMNLSLRQTVGAAYEEWLRKSITTITKPNETGDRFTPSRPTAPTNVNVTSVIERAGKDDFARMTVTWDHSPDRNIVYYTVRYRVQGASTWQTASTGGKEKSLDIGGAIPATDYELQVNASSKTGQVSDWSAVVVHKTPKDSTIPATPAAPTVESAIRGVIVRVVTPNTEPDLAAYEVHISPTSGFTPDTSTLKTSIPAGPGEPVSKEIIDLVPGQDYYVRLIAVDTSGNRSPASFQGTAIADAVEQQDITDDVLPSGETNWHSGNMPSRRFQLCGDTRGITVENVDENVALFQVFLQPGERIILRRARFHIDRSPLSELLYLVVTQPDVGPSFREWVSEWYEGEVTPNAEVGFNPLQEGRMSLLAVRLRLVTSGPATSNYGGWWLDLEIVGPQ